MTPVEMLAKLEKQFPGWAFGVAECSHGIAVRGLSPRILPVHNGDKHLAVQIAGEPEEVLVALTMKISAGQFDGTYFLETYVPGDSVVNDLLTQKLGPLPDDIADYQAIGM